MFDVPPSTSRGDAVVAGEQFRYGEVVLMGDAVFDADAADAEQGPRSIEEGRLFVDAEERERGNHGPFFALYR
ncbi:MAG: hypothetical protein R3324_19745, partial [Halobacteriales archaeon]|nr:hypothetical protein [Halobacteriales archaeon]